MTISNRVDKHTTFTNFMSVYRSKLAEELFMGVEQCGREPAFS